MRRMFCGTFIIACLLGWPCFARADVGDTMKKITNTAVKKVFPGVGSPFGRHENIPPFIVKGKPVFLLAIRNEDGSRCTNNFTVADEYKGDYTCYVTEVPKTKLIRMRFQRKGDKKAGVDNLTGEDSNRGAAFRAGSTVTLDGTHNYLAERDFDAKKLLEEHEYAMVIFLPAGLTLDEVLEAMLGLEDKK